MSVQYKGRLSVPQPNNTVTIRNNYIDYIFDEYQDGSYAHGVFPTQMPLLVSQQQQQAVRKEPGVVLDDSTGNNWVDVTVPIKMPASFLNLYFTPTPNGPPNNPLTQFPFYPSYYSNTDIINPYTRRVPTEFPNQTTRSYNDATKAIGPEKTYRPLPAGFDQNDPTPGLHAGEQSAEGNLGFFQIGFSGQAINTATKYFGDNSFYNKETSLVYIEIGIWDVTAVPVAVNANEDTYWGFGFNHEHVLGCVDQTRYATPNNVYQIRARKSAISQGNGYKVILDSAQLILHLIS